MTARWIPGIFLASKRRKGKALHRTGLHPIQVMDGLELLPFRYYKTKQSKNLLLEVLNDSDKKKSLINGSPADNVYSDTSISKLKKLSLPLTGFPHMVL